MAENPSTVQSLIFAKSEFERRSSAVSWAKNHDFLFRDVDETGQSFRLRQRHPDDFDQKTLRTISLSKGVDAVIGRLK